ncbi:MAG: dodecin family protein [Anaerolineales bacterium]|jgi:hypothetical protein
MAVAKVIEIQAESYESWDHAARQALIQAAKSVPNLRSIYLTGYQEIFDEKSIAPYLVKANIYLSYEDGDGRAK